MDGPTNCAMGREEKCAAREAAGKGKKMKQKQIQVYTLVGRSGTGKSFHAMELCRKNRIDGIIDDGLFIYQNTIIAGMSAKRSQTKIGAVKAALFIEEERCREVREAIAEKQPRSILVLGTSDEMVDKIIERLGLPPLSADSPRRIHIEDITTEEERAVARQQRDKLGKHVIPAPALQLKHNFAGYFMDPLRLLRGKDQGAAAERTVVRPTYSYMGEYYVAEHVMDDIVNCVAQAMPAVSRVVYVSHGTLPEAYELLVVIRMRKGYPLWETAGIFQTAVKDAVETMTAFNVVRVDVEVRGLA